MAEHQIVDLAVEGSNPSSHPNLSIHFAYTKWVDDRPVVWDDANRKHLGSDHPERNISIAEIEKASDADRIEIHVADRLANQVIGRTSTGRWLVVIWVDDREGRYPIHAREASKRIIRRISK